jgi:hypothetical protein
MLETHFKVQRNSHLLCAVVELIKVRRQISTHTCNIQHLDKDLSSVALIGNWGRF